MHRYLIALALLLAAAPARATDGPVQATDTPPTVGVACGSYPGILVDTTSGSWYVCDDDDLDGTNDWRLLPAGQASGTSIDYDGDGRYEISCDGTDCSYDLDDDGTVDMTGLVGTPGSRASQPGLAFGAGTSGAAWVSPFGVTMADGRLPGPMAMITFAGDNHDEDWHNTVNEFVPACVENNLPGCTIHIMRGDVTGDDTSDDTVTASELQDWVSRRHEIGAHSVQHMYCGYDDADGNPDFGEANNYGLETSGSVSLTNGSATVEGTGTNWGRTTSQDYSPIKAEIWFDTDGDATFSDETRYYIQSVTDTDTLTLTRAYAGSTASPVNYEIRSSWWHCVYEVEENMAQIAADVGTDYTVFTWANPGQWVNDDDMSQATKIAHRLELSTSYGFSGEEGGSEYVNDWGSARTPTRLMNFPVTCTDDWTTGWKDLIDLAIEDRAWLVINTHRVIPTGESCSSSNTPRALFDQMAAYAKAAQDDGKLLIVTHEQGARLYRSWPSQTDWNLLTNTGLHDADGITQASYHWFGWRDYTANLDSYSESDGVLTVTDDDGDGVLTYTQYKRLEPGDYIAGIEVRTGDLLGATNYRIALTGPGTDTDDWATTLDPVWYDPVSRWHYGAGRSNARTESNVRFLLMAQFHVPPGLNEPVGFQFRTANLNGTVEFTKPFLARRYPTDLGTRWGQGNGVKMAVVSRADPTLTTGEPYALKLGWNPAEEARIDAPLQHPYGFFYLDGSDVKHWFEWADIVSAGYADKWMRGKVWVDGDYDSTYDDLTLRTETVWLSGRDAHLDPDLDGVAEKALSAGGWVDMDVDGTDEFASCGAIAGDCVWWAWQVPDDYVDNGLDGTDDDIRITIQASPDANSDGTNTRVYWQAAITCATDLGTIAYDSGASYIGSSMTETVSSVAPGATRLHISSSSCTGCDSEIDPGAHCMVTVTRRDATEAGTGIQFPYSMLIRGIRLEYGVRED